MPIIIDGHNLLYAVKSMTDDQIISELQLCNLISRYLKSIRQKGEIIFDGTGPPDKTGLLGSANLEILFSGSYADADSFIEDKITASTAPKRLTVVSSDHRLKKAAKARKAAVITADDFWSKVFKRLSRRRTPEPACKRDGISESETEFWLKFFKLDK